MSHTSGRNAEVQKKQACPEQQGLLHLPAEADSQPREWHQEPGCELSQCILFLSLKAYLPGHQNNNAAPETTRFDHQ